MTEEKNIMQEMTLKRGDVVELKKGMLPEEFRREGTTRFAIVVGSRKSKKFDSVIVMPITIDFRLKNDTEKKLMLRMKKWYHFYCDFAEESSFIVINVIRTINKCRIERIAGKCVMDAINLKLKELFQTEQIESTWNRSWLQKNDLVFYDWGEIDEKENFESEGTKFRPSLVLYVNDNDRTAIIVPLTSSKKKCLSGMLEITTDDINRNYGRPELVRKEHSIICFDKYRTIYVDFFHTKNFYKAGEVHPELYEKINGCIKASLGLECKYNKGEQYGNGNC